VLPRCGRHLPSTPVPWCLVVGETGAGERSWEEGYRPRFNARWYPWRGTPNTGAPAAAAAPSTRASVGEPSRFGGARRVVSGGAEDMLSQRPVATFHKLAADGARRRGKSSPDAKQSAGDAGGGGASGWAA